MVNEMKKPSIFRIQDTLTFGVLSIISLILAIYVSMKADDIPASSMALIWVVALCFIGIYQCVLWMRYKFLSDFKYAIPDNFLVDPSGYKVSQEQISSEINRVVSILEKNYTDTKNAIKSDVIYIKFNDGPLPPQTEFGVKRMGYVVVNGNVAYVAYLKSDEKVNETALGHEISHIILGRVTGDWDCDIHHKIMQQLGVG